MWGSIVTREGLLQKISLLALLGPVREGETEHKLDSRLSPKKSMTIEQEAEVVSNLAFLSYRRKDSQAVSAVCIEEDDDNQGMTVRTAVNGGAAAHTSDGLSKRVPFGTRTWLSTFLPLKSNS